MQAQIAALVGVGAGGVEVARPQKREEQVEAAWRSKQGFITTCRLYIRMEDPLEIQIQWILSYVQKELADVWKENLLEELEIKKIDLPQ